MIKDGLKPYRILWDPSFLRWVHDECFQEFHDVLWFDRDRETTTHLHQRWSLAATKIATEAFERGMGLAAASRLGGLFDVEGRSSDSWASRLSKCAAVSGFCCLLYSDDKR